MLENIEYTESEGFRFERKYVGNSVDIKNSEMIIRMNPAGFSSVFSERFINNIYFDTERFDFFYDNVNGRHDRVKYRIRWYGDLFQNIENPILELKSKHGQVGTKQSFLLKSFDFKKNFNFKMLQKVFQESNLPEDVFFKLKHLKPTLINRYKRKYYRDFSGDYRLTLDRDIQYFPTTQIAFGKITTTDFLSHIIELKYDNAKDDKADKITNFLPFRLSKNSKYQNGIEIFHYVLD